MTNTPVESRRRGPTKGDLRYARLLGVGEKLLAEKPLRDITIDEIARRAQVTRPAFYFYFDSKYALLAALLERVLATQFDTADRLWINRPAELTPRQACEQHFTEMLALWRRHAVVMREAAEAVRLHTAVERAYGQLLDRFIDAASTQITKERAAGVAPPGADVRALATTLTWMTERNLYAAVAGLGPDLTDRQRVTALADAWLRAIYETAAP
ncbi:TetR/AcrR family transcriptional regulator [Catenuloplanes atrovinosus]|uniref:AcrR family transcriptional regulator n=1 Tax=Catenuloplanes atrovinosus TaxID=137266 RepID=A0AAE3YT05_9ACTN|nr:TetR/AcrR family transcriptional regulator [Catenuloplanes atrovinosus]MDR7277311.1 AcrR family transcriptional regulator [Catenuloplanes atrovinosus]